MCFCRVRLRLREEVDILQHLTTGGQHPNILAYIDSWEEDEALFIRTELCELGNFAHFLWEYGKAFPRLDEPRVWKVFADLSNVSGTLDWIGVLLMLFALCRVSGSSMSQVSST